MNKQFQLCNNWPVHHDFICVSWKENVEMCMCVSWFDCYYHQGLRFMVWLAETRKFRNILLFTINYHPNLMMRTLLLLLSLMTFIQNCLFFLVVISTKLAIETPFSFMSYFSCYVWSLVNTFLLSIHSIFLSEPLSFHKYWLWLGFLAYWLYFWLVSST